MQRLNPYTETIRTSIALEEDTHDSMQECMGWMNITKSEFIREAIEYKIKLVRRAKRKERKQAIQSERERLDDG